MGNGETRSPFFRGFFLNILKRTIFVVVVCNRHKVMCCGLGAMLRSRQNVFGPLFRNVLDPPLRIPVSLKVLSSWGC